MDSMKTVRGLSKVGAILLKIAQVISVIGAVFLLLTLFTLVLTPENAVAREIGTNVKMTLNLADWLGADAWREQKVDLMDRILRQVGVTAVAEPAEKAEEKTAEETAATDTAEEVTETAEETATEEVTEPEKAEEKAEEATTDGAETVGATETVLYDRDGETVYNEGEKTGPRRPGSGRRGAHVRSREIRRHDRPAPQARRYDPVGTGRPSRRHPAGRFEVRTRNKLPGPLHGGLHRGGLRRLRRRADRGGRPLGRREADPRQSGAGRGKRG